MRRLWAWYWAWTVADVATTLYFHHAGIGIELNPLINALATVVGFDAACITAVLATTALLWLMLRLSRGFYNVSRTFLQRFIALLPVAVKAIMATRFVAALNNLLIITAGLGLVDLLAFATRLPVYQAYFVLTLLVVTPHVIYYYRKTPPPPRNFPVSSAGVKA